MDTLVTGAHRLGLDLTSRQVEQFEVYYHELIEWNKKINLTAITDYRSVQTKHFLDSLTVALALPPEAAARSDYRIVDIGTGAGFPGLPLKILFPQFRLLLIESISKKAAFVDHIIRRLELENVEVLNARAEEAARLPLYREQFALVVSRAVAALPSLVELALPFCQIGGKFVAQKKGNLADEVKTAGKAIAVLGGKLDQIKTVELSELDDTRYLVIIDKICATPDRYPRRPGMPARRPI